MYALFKEEEMTEQAKKRRIQDTLTIAGSAVVAFGIWSLAKTGLFISLVDESTLRLMFGINGISLTVTVYVLLAVLVVVDMCLRAYVGLSARGEGHGKKKSPFYLVVAAIAAIANACTLSAIAFITSLATSPIEAMVSVVIELTAIAALALVIFSSIRLRRMNKVSG